MAGRVRATELTLLHIQGKPKNKSLSFSFFLSFFVFCFRVPTKRHENEQRFHPLSTFLYGERRMFQKGSQQKKKNEKQKTTKKKNRSDAFTTKQGNAQGNGCSSSSRPPSLKQMRVLSTATVVQYRASVAITSLKKDEEEEEEWGFPSIFFPARPHSSVQSERMSEGHRRAAE